MGKLNYIILIDDDEATNVYHSIIIEDSNVVEKHEIFDCPITALDFLIDQKNVPDLILLDVNMPKMTGWEFLEEYRKHKEILKFPKVFMLTTSLATFDKTMAEANPIVSGYRQKPLTQKMLEEIVECVLA